MGLGNRSIPGKEAPKVRYSNSGSVREQVGFLRRQFLQDGDRPFTDILTEDVIAQALATVGGWLDRVFSPLVTLWVFLGQVLSADHSCRAAVARLIAHRLARRQRPCSAETGAYCPARKRLPEQFFADAVAGLPKLGRSHRHFNAPVLIVSVRHWHGSLVRSSGSFRCARRAASRPPSAKRPTFSRIFLYLSQTAPPSTSLLPDGSLAPVLSEELSRDVPGWRSS